MWNFRWLSLSTNVYTKTYKITNWPNKQSTNQKINKLAKSTQQKPSEQAHNSSASQDTPTVLQKPDVCNFPPLVPVQSQINLLAPELFF